MLKRVYIVLLLLLCACTWLHAQDLSNRGKEFWVGYGHSDYMEPGSNGHNPDYDNSQEMVLYLSAQEPAEVTVTVNNTGWTRHYSIPANTVIASDLLPKGTDATGVDCRLFSLPPRFGGSGSEGLFPKHGIHIESNVPIVAYSHGFAEGSSGASMLMPVETWGYTYYSVNTNQRGPSGAYSWTYVVASHDNTVVEITPAMRTRSGKPGGVMFPVTLNKGEIYQVMADNSIDQEATGTKFKSVANATGQCYPIAVFSGSSATTNPMLCGEGFTDADMQELFPLQAWGKRYLTAPVCHSQKPAQPLMNSYKILVNDPTTVVKVNGRVLTGLFNNFYYYESRNPDLIEADKPIMVAQFITGQFGNCSAGDLNSDPDMFYISPVDQGIDTIGFFRNNRVNISVNYLIMIVPNGGTGLSSLRIDGKALSALAPTDYYTYPHPQLPGYTVVIRRWSGFPAWPAPAPGQCRVTSDSNFTAVTVGMGPAETYSYNAGTHINNLHANSMLHNTLDAVSASDPFTCQHTPVAISALIAYKPTQIVWKLSALAGQVTPAADITDNAPVPVETVMVNGSLYYRYTLTDTYLFNTAGIYYLPLVLTNPEIDKCDHTEEIKLKLEVKTEPVADFSFTHQPTCSQDTIRVAAVASTADGYTLQTWNWQFPDGAIATGINASHVAIAGADQSIVLSAITREGCVADTAKKITVYATPAAAFSLTNNTCSGKAVTITPAATIDAGETISQWNWNFGDGSKNTLTSGAVFEHAYTRAGSYPVVLVVSSSHCTSAADTQLLVVQPAPVVDFAVPDTICMPGGSAAFTNKTTIAANADVNYQWNFGDGSGSSKAVNPTYSYAKSGSYKVQLTAASAFGCKDSVTKIVDKFYDRPVAAFTVTPQELCQGAPTVFADGSTVNGSTISSWSWSFGDGSGAAVKTPKKTFTSAGSFPVSLVVKSAQGCTSAAYAIPVTVHRQPVVNAGSSFVVKEGTHVQFDAFANASNYTFSWQPVTGLNDPTILRPELTVTDDAVYTITATGEFHCTASDSLKITLLREVIPPNVFSPNGDGMHDVWQIDNLSKYVNAVVDVYNRYGQHLYHSNGYAMPWNGTYNGKELPIATYYYIISLGNGSKPLSGPVTILR